MEIRASYREYFKPTSIVVIAIICFLTLIPHSDNAFEYFPRVFGNTSIFVIALLSFRFSTLILLTLSAIWLFIPS